MGHRRLTPIAACAATATLLILAVAALGNATPTPPPGSATAPPATVNPGTAPEVTAPAEATADQVIEAARAASPQIDSAALVGFETVWEVRTTIPATDDGYLAGKVVCVAVLNVVAVNDKDVTVRSADDRILATGTAYSGECRSWR